MANQNINVASKLFAYISHGVDISQTIKNNYIDSLIFIGDEGQIYNPRTNTYIGIGQSAYTNCVAYMNWLGQKLDALNAALMSSMVSKVFAGVDDYDLVDLGVKRSVGDTSKSAKYATSYITIKGLGDYDPNTGLAYTTTSFTYNNVDGNNVTDTEGSANVISKNKFGTSGITVSMTQSQSSSVKDSLGTTHSSTLRNIITIDDSLTWSYMAAAYTYTLDYADRVATEQANRIYHNLLGDEDVAYTAIAYTYFFQSYVSNEHAQRTTPAISEGTTVKTLTPNYGFNIDRSTGDIIDAKTGQGVIADISWSSNSAYSKLTYAVATNGTLTINIYDANSETGVPTRSTTWAYSMGTEVASAFNYLFKYSSGDSYTKVSDAIESFFGWADGLPETETGELIWTNGGYQKQTIDKKYTLSSTINGAHAAAYAYWNNTTKVANDLVPGEFWYKRLISEDEFKDLVNNSIDPITGKTLTLSAADIARIKGQQITTYDEDGNSVVMHYVWELAKDENGNPNWLTSTDYTTVTSDTAVNIAPSVSNTKSWLGLLNPVKDETTGKYKVSNYSEITSALKANTEANGYAAESELTDGKYHPIIYVRDVTSQSTYNMNLADGINTLKEVAYLLDQLTDGLDNTYSYTYYMYEPVHEISYADGKYYWTNTNVDYYHRNVEGQVKSESGDVVFASYTLFEDSNLRSNSYISYAYYWKSSADDATTTEYTYHLYNGTTTVTGTTTDVTTVSNWLFNYDYEYIYTGSEDLSLPSDTILTGNSVRASQLNKVDKNYYTYLTYTKVIKTSAVSEGKVTYQTIYYTTDTAGVYDGGAYILAGTGTGIATDGISSENLGIKMAYTIAGNQEDINELDNRLDLIENGDQNVRSLMTTNSTFVTSTLEASHDNDVIFKEGTTYTHINDNYTNGNTTGASYVMGDVNLKVDLTLAQTYTSSLDWKKLLVKADNNKLSGVSYYSTLNPETITSYASDINYNPRNNSNQTYYWIAPNSVLSDNSSFEPIYREDIINNLVSNAGVDVYAYVSSVNVSGTINTSTYALYVKSGEKYLRIRETDYDKVINSFATAQQIVDDSTSIKWEDTTSVTANVDGKDYTLYTTYNVSEGTGNISLDGVEYRLVTSTDTPYEDTNWYCEEHQIKELEDPTEEHKFFIIKYNTNSSLGTSISSVSVYGISPSSVDLTSSTQFYISKLGNGNYRTVSTDDNESIPSDLINGTLTGSTHAIANSSVKTLANTDSDGLVTVSWLKVYTEGITSSIDEKISSQLISAYNHADKLISELNNSYTGTSSQYTYAISQVNGKVYAKSRELPTDRIDSRVEVWGTNSSTIYNDDIFTAVPLDSTSTNGHIAGKYSYASLLLENASTSYEYYVVQNIPAVTHKATEADITAGKATSVGETIVDTAAHADVEYFLVPENSDEFKLTKNNNTIVVDTDVITKYHLVPGSGSLTTVLYLYYKDEATNEFKILDHNWYPANDLRHINVYVKAYKFTEINAENLLFEISSENDKLNLLTSDKSHGVWLYNDDLNDSISSAPIQTTTGTETIYYKSINISFNESGTVTAGTLECTYLNTLDIDFYATSSKPYADTGLTETSYVNVVVYYDSDAGTTETSRNYTIYVKNSSGYKTAVTLSAKLETGAITIGALENIYKVPALYHLPSVDDSELVVAFTTDNFVALDGSTVPQIFKKVTSTLTKSTKYLSTSFQHYSSAEFGEGENGMHITAYITNIEDASQDNTGFADAYDVRSFIDNICSWVDISASVYEVKSDKNDLTGDVIRINPLNTNTSLNDNNNYVHYHEY